MAIITFLDSENRPDPPAGTVSIELTRGYVAWIDEEDLSKVSGYKWYAHAPCREAGYACSATGFAGSGRVPRIVRMHRLLCAGNPQVDHRSHELFTVGVIDNRKSNLRPAGRHENMRSQRKCHTTKTSIFKGVGFESFTGRWKSSINTGGKNTSLGRFHDEVHAAYMYDLEAVRRFGEFALTNFPVPGSVNYLYG